MLRMFDLSFQVFELLKIESITFLIGRENDYKFIVDSTWSRSWAYFSFSYSIVLRSDSSSTFCRSSFKELVDSNLAYTCSLFDLILSGFNKVLVRINYFSFTKIQNNYSICFLLSLWARRGFWPPHNSFSNTSFAPLSRCCLRNRVWISQTPLVCPWTYFSLNKKIFSNLNYWKININRI